MSEAILVVVKETKHIPLDDIDISLQQFRTRNIDKGIEELAENIKAVGLINAITVCEGENGKYELIAGQRRYLAHQHLDAETIRANVLERRLTDEEKRKISVSENITIKPPSRADYIDACTDLYRRYGTIQEVSLQLGLKYATVSDYVHYDQLRQPLKDLVDEGIINVKTAKRAQEAAVNEDGEIDEEDAVAYAKEMRTMSNEGQKRMLDVAKKNPKASTAEKIEKGRKQAAVTRLSITIANDVNDLLREYAKTEGAKVDDAATILIEEGLEQKGYFKKNS